MDTEMDSLYSEVLLAEKEFEHCLQKTRHVDKQIALRQQELSSLDGEIESTRLEIIRVGEETARAEVSIANLAADPELPEDAIVPSTNPEPTTCFLHDNDT